MNIVGRLSAYAIPLITRHFIVHDVARHRFVMIGSADVQSGSGKRGTFQSCHLSCLGQLLMAQ